MTDTQTESVVVDPKDEALANARAATERLKGLAEEARGGRMVESSVIDVYDDLQAALSAVESAFSPVDQEATAVQSFLTELSTALQTIRDRATS